MSFDIQVFTLITETYNTDTSIEDHQLLFVKCKLIFSLFLKHYRYLGYGVSLNFYLEHDLLAMDGWTDAHTDRQFFKVNTQKFDKRCLCFKIDLHMVRGL